MASPSRLSVSWRALLGAAALLFFVAGLADPSEARRFRFGSSGGSSSERIEKVFELPRIEELKLDDGRYVDIGRIQGGTNTGKLVGYVGPGRQYLDLPYEQMTELVRHGGFDSVEALERHLASEKQGRVDAAQAKRQEAQARTKEANEERRRKRDAARDAAKDAGGTTATSTGVGTTIGLGLGALVIAIIALLALLLAMAFGAVALLWPLILIGVVIWLVVRQRGGGKSGAVKTDAARDGQALATVHAPTRAGSTHASSSGSFDALAGRTPVAVRYADGSTGSSTIGSPAELAALLGATPSTTPAKPADAAPRASVVQSVSRRGGRDGRIAQPRAFGKRG